MCFITRLGDAGAVWILLAIIINDYPRTRKSGAVLMIALGVDIVLCNGILKPLIARIRPCDANTSIQLLIARPHDFSFPSGHTAASFAAVGALLFSGEKKLWKPVLVSCSSSCIFTTLLICALSNGYFGRHRSRECLWVCRI